MFYEAPTLFSPKSQQQPMVKKDCALNNDTIPIPSYRRVRSYVGTKEGFDVFCPKDFIFKDGPPTPAGSMGAIDLPSPKQEFAQKYTFKGDSAVRFTQGDLNFDDANVNMGCVLGAIPTCAFTEVEKLDKPDQIEDQPVEDKPDKVEDKPCKTVKLETSVYSLEQRKQRIEKYRAKRASRVFGKKIMYDCRKTFAVSRPRVGGRFIKNDDLPTYLSEKNDNWKVHPSSKPNSKANSFSSDISTSSDDSSFEFNLRVDIPDSTDSIKILTDKVDNLGMISQSLFPGLPMELDYDGFY